MQQICMQILQRHQLASAVFSRMQGLLHLKSVTRAYFGEEEMHAKKYCIFGGFKVLFKR
jgi:hypothetical protein